MDCAELVFYFRIFPTPQTETPFRPNQERKITTLNRDYLKFVTVRKTKFHCESEF